jgi:hypothetical protein
MEARLNGGVAFLRPPSSPFAFFVIPAEAGMTKKKGIFAAHEGYGGNSPATPLKPPDLF